MTWVAAASAAANAARGFSDRVKASSQRFKESTGISPGKVLGFSALAAAAFFGFRSLARGSAQRNEEKKIGETHVRQASMLVKLLVSEKKFKFLSLFATGLTAMVDMIASQYSKVDMEALEKITMEVTDWKAVSNSYRRLTRGRHLLDDMRKKLGEENYIIFMDKVGKKSREVAADQARREADMAQLESRRKMLYDTISSGKQGIYTYPGYLHILLRAAKDMTLLTFTGNTAYTAEAGDYLGKFTGKFSHRPGKKVYFELEDQSSSKVWADLQLTTFDSGSIVR